MAQNVTEMIPRVRRALEGANATEAELSNDAAKAIIADAIADIILYSRGAFGHTLTVTARDDTTDAPTEWEVDPALEIHEEGIVVAQAAINYIFFDLRSGKIQETISSEGESWTYATSANAIAEQLKFLIRMRDEAIASVEAGGTPLDGFVSFIGSRDQYAAAIIEPWTSAGLIGQGQ